MTARAPTATEIELLVGTLHPAAGFEYPPVGLQPYYQWLVGALHLLAESSAAALRVQPDAAGDALAYVAPGRATINGASLTFTGQTIDLATFNNDTAYLWAEDDTAGSLAIASAPAATGWPTTPHLKLAEVTLAAGQITTITDRRFETALRVGLDPQDATALPAYDLTLTTQGNTATPSQLRVTLRDHHGQPIAATDHLRVRVCDDAAYANATNAAIAAAAGTTTVETLTANKDLVLQSDAAGQFNLDLTNATAETVTLRLGPAPLSARRADTTNTLDVTHT